MANNHDRRNGRDQQYNNIGSQGRITGIRPPSNVARDSGGNERASQFFGTHEDDHRDDHYDHDDNDATRPFAQRSGPRSSQQSLNSSQANPKANRERPQRFNEIGEKGRKTGITLPRVSVDAYGYQNPDQFFKSPDTQGGGSGAIDQSSPRNASSAATSSRKAVNSRDSSRQSGQPVQLEQYDAYDRDFDDREFGGNNDEEEDYGDSADMDLDDGSSMTPISYQRGNRNNARGASGLRNSITYGSPEHRGEASGSGSGNTNGRRPNARDRSENVQSDDSDEEAVAHSLTNSATRSHDSSNHRLVQLGKSGQPVRQDKGKARLVRSPTPEEEPEPEHHYHDQDGFQDDDDDDGAGEAYDDFDTNQDGGGRGGGVGRYYHDHDDDDQDGEEERMSPSRPKGKGRARTSNASNSTNSPASAQKRQMTAKAKQTNGAKEVRKAPPRRRRDSDSDDDGSSESDNRNSLRLHATDTAPLMRLTERRSNRQRLAPVEYWRNERVVYKRRPSGLGITEVVLYPKPDPEPLAAQRKKGGRSTSQAPRGRAQSVKAEAKDEEEGVDSLTDPEGLVWSWEGQAETQRRVAFTKKMINTKPAGQGEFRYQKIFSELDYLAGGIIDIPSGSEKPQKPSKDNTYIFYCIQGSCSVTVHRTKFAIGPGACFLVPRGNKYQIVATSNRDVRLFFTQSRRVSEKLNGDTIADTEQQWIDLRDSIMGPPQGDEPMDGDEDEDEDEEEESGDDRGRDDDEEEEEE
ncbi:BQ2448_2146 [Microbotryum intermedium]|uniref:CENP-C homolog n=1 Tax=Microbotryum intermedium TaxID=269621 RepID=A0A238FDF6_9BASI|nr:BQ2448_2146 [Microbotryum intermedium]